LVAAPRINLGRGAEVRNDRNRLIRTNDVVFKEGAGELNRSVSRAHAHLAFDAGARCYRLFDNGSSHGTGIIRGGRTISVPQGARGVRIEPGDEIVLGEVRIAVAR
jgi:pSer/pThr/pTyr-binding forkhead associated (FHA) protein